MLEAITKAALAYLIGTIMGGSVVGRLKGGVDLSAVGSGNVGTTNALRTQGAGFALAVLAIDAGKGALAAVAIPYLPWPWSGSASWSREQLGFVCGVAAALGHCYPVWSNFRGGKGVATLTGVFAALLPQALVWMLPAFALVVVLSGYVGLASVAAALTAVLYITCFDDRGLFGAPGYFTLAMAVLVVFKHRQNLARIWSGTEHRFGKAMLFHKLAARWQSR